MTARSITLLGKVPDDKWYVFRTLTQGGNHIIKRRAIEGDIEAQLAALEQTLRG
jgi:hypothetical protein